MFTCIICGKYSLSSVCGGCKKAFFAPVPATRIVKDDFKVHSFFKLGELQDIAHTKYCLLGSRMYRFLSKEARKFFYQGFDPTSKVYLIPIDDVPKRGYSQNAIMAKEFSNKNLIPLYASLGAQNDVNYAGKKLDFRIANKKGFRYKGKKGISAILLDDIITTGTTMNEAYETLTQEGIDVLFGLTLFDARDKMEDN